MIAAILLAAAPVATAVDAERAFARDAQRLGQWTAFRRWADPTAVMFTPQATWAQGLLKGRRNPPRSVRLASGRSYLSFFVLSEVNSGPWRGPYGSGYFNTLLIR